MNTQKDKPTRPNQVFGYPGDGVKLRRHYQNRHLDEDIKTIRKVGETAAKVKINEFEMLYYLADLGMIAYADGTWHPYNWCERI